MTTDKIEKLFSEKVITRTAIAKLLYPGSSRPFDALDGKIRRAKLKKVEPFTEGEMSEILGYLREMRSKIDDAIGE